jgi:hypothetical protein
MFPPNVAGIFIKPVDIHELEASLRRLLRLPRSGREPVTPAQR